jgi:exosortase/archaeosortase family protein
MIIKAFQDNDKQISGHVNQERIICGENMAFEKIGLLFLKHKGLRGGTLFLGVFIAGCWLFSINGVRDYWEQLFALATAKIATRILTYLGMGIQANGNSLALHGFSVDIGPGCIAFYEIFVFAAAIIAYPLRIKDKFAGVVLGMVAVWATNLLRVIGLFLSGVYFPSVFELLHDHVVQAIFVLFMVVLWISYVGKSTKRVAAQ